MIVDAYLCGHDHNMQHWYHNRIHYFTSGLGQIGSPNMRNMNNPLNPVDGFDYFTILKGERLGIFMVDATEDEISFRLVSGVGNEHYKNTIRKRTAV